MTDPPVSGATQDLELPAWLAGTSLVLVVGLAVIGTVATTLALLQVLHAWLVLALAVPLLGLAVWWLRPLVGTPRRGQHLPAAVGLALILGITGFNVAHAAEHLLIGRDPGIQVVAGRQLATESDLFLAHDDYGLADETGFVFTAGGQYTWGDDATVPQGVHLLPAILAVAWGVGGTAWLLAATPVIGGVVLLAFFVFAARIVRPWWALAATAALAVSQPQIHFGRDAFTEIPTQVFLLGAIWAVTVAHDGGRRRWWVLGGFLAGLTLATRLDALLLVAPLLLAVGLLEVGLVGREGTVQPGAVGRFLVGLLPGAALVLADTVGPAWPYVAGRLEQTLLLVVMLCMTLLVVRGILRRTSRADIPARWRERIGRTIPVVSVAVPLVLALLWLLPPLFVESGLLDAREKGGRPTWGEYGLYRIGMFYGAVPLALAFAGIGIALRRWQSRPAVPALVLLVAAAPSVALYVLWAPQIFPDLPWAMRRFLPIVIPMVVVMAALAGEWLVDVIAARWRTLAPVAAAAAVALLLAVPVRTSRPILDLRRFEGLTAGIATMCERLPDDTVVALAADRGEIDVTLPAAIAAFCDVPVVMYSRHEARGDPVDLDPYRRAAREARDDGRTFTLLTSSPLEEAGLTSELLLDIQLPTLRWEYTRVPDTIVPWHVRVHATVVPVG